MRSQIDADLLFEFSSCFRRNTDLLVTCCGSDNVALDDHGMGKERKEGETSELLQVESWVGTSEKSHGCANRNGPQGVTIGRGRRESWKHQKVTK